MITETTIPEEQIREAWNVYKSKRSFDSITDEGSESQNAFESGWIEALRKSGIAGVEADRQEEFRAYIQCAQALDKAKTELTAKNAEIERLAKSYGTVCAQNLQLAQELTAAREREEEALALLKETRKWMDPIMGEWDANFIRQFDFAIAAFDASRAVDGKEGA